MGANLSGELRGILREVIARGGDYLCLNDDKSAQENLDSVGVIRYY